MASTSKRFVDNFSRALDSKSRFSIPASWRPRVGEDFYLFPRENARVAVLTKKEVESVLKKIHADPGINADEKEVQSQALFANTILATTDNQKKLTLDPSLIRHMKLPRVIVLVGKGKRFGLWNVISVKLQQPKR